jgi:CheY-like chemotaxis protein
MTTIYNYRILLADDDADDVELLEYSIHKSAPHAQIHTAENGKVALEYLNGLPEDLLPHVIIMDLNMPVMSGFEVLDHICRDTRYEKIPKLILSTSNSPLHMSECNAKGATDYFVKPDNMEALESLANIILDYCRQGVMN